MSGKDELYIEELESENAKLKAAAKIAKENGDECAFPFQPVDISCAPEFGMTKREFFAARAMEALIVAQIPNMPDEIIIRQSTWFADALLAELAKGEGEK